MTSTNDNIISKLTVRLTDTKTQNTIGTGVIYYAEQLKEIVYVLTAAHCLFEDGEEFKIPLQEINIDFYNSLTDTYHSINKKIDSKLVLKESEKDLAILVFDKVEIESSIGEIPKVFCVKQRNDHNNFAVKGFPNATQGKELDVIFPTWKQEMTEVYKFQIQLNEDYTSWATMGFSGSGIFLIANEDIYLFGIFTRFRPEEKGRVIYCQYLDTINELLNRNYLPPINFSYLGSHGMTPSFFKKRIEFAIENLGPRFNEKLNFRLPIALKFIDICKDDSFKARIFKIFDEWLTEKSYRILRENEQIGDVEIKLLDLRSRVKDWLSNIKFTADKSFDANWIFDEVYELDDFIYKKMDHVYALRKQKEGESKNIKRDYSYRAPFENEFERLREIKEHNANFLGKLENDVDIKLANKPVLIIRGEAGCGKSHLLGDIATEKLKKNVPVFLLLGQHFSSTKSIAANILEQLDLRCDFNKFLESLNDIGSQMNSRVLIMIDALNESKNSDLWKDHLSGFMKEISNYPFIGLVLTIRSTYFQSVIPEKIRLNKEISIITHEGFRGNEYAALKLFCEYFGLKQPTFPILAPEFTNPLFLQLVCIGVKNSADKAFPLGFHGITKVFDLYIAALNKKLLEKPEYTLRKTLVSDAINKFAALCFEKDKRMLTIEETLSLFDVEFSKFPTLLLDLIQENVFVKNLHYDYESDKEEESVYFAYERFGDFYIAEELLSEYTSEGEVIKAFEKGSAFDNFLDDYYKHGLIEAIAVLLPEKYGIEIFEAFNWALVEEENSKSHYRAKTHLISDKFLKGLTWRSISSINSEKIDIWLSSDNFLVDEDEWLLKLLELSAVPGHPLNSDRLHRILKRFTMSERDSFWQSFLLSFSGYDDYGSAFPIRRLIDWAWTKDISSTLNYETARLTAQSLTWILASTNISLRDQCTKAMVNLLEEQPEVLVNILKEFRRTNDMYILERLYAIAYGCILRTSKIQSITLIAKYTYSSIFKNLAPPKHILLRDYARNICEFAMHRKISAKFDMDIVRPPYKTEIPIFPSQEDISKYKIEYNKETENIPNRIPFNSIYNSVISGDFGNKIIDSALHSFSPLKINGEEELKNFNLSLDKASRKLLRSCFMIVELHYRYSKNRNRRISFFETEKKLDEHLKTLEDALKEALNFFDSEQRNWVENSGIPYLELKLKIKNGERFLFQGMPIKRWIVQRVFQLGYQKDKHGAYDSSAGSFNDRHSNKVERIGKKYQWIAYYEILGMIADNFELEERRGNRRKFYKGAWQLYLRDIDPAFITQIDDEEKKDDLEIIFNEKKWWNESKYIHWNIPSAQWASQVEDLPSPKGVIIKNDENGIEWVHLEHFVEWRQPKNLGEDKYFSPYKQIWYMIQAYIVQKRDKAKIVNYLSEKNFWGRWMPENHDGFSRLINREKFWSPCYFDEGKDLKWETIRDTNLKVIVATTSAKGGMEDDKSGANSNYNIPCQTLFEGMNLQYASNDGDFIDTAGETIVTNINPKGTMIRKDKLVDFLSQNNLEIIWTLLGEKISDLGDHNYDFGVPCGVFYLDNDSFKGKIIMHERT